MEQKPEYSILRQEILNDLKQDIKVNANLKMLRQKINAKTVTYVDAANFSKVFGDAVSKSIVNNIPDGVEAQFLEEFAEECLGPLYRQCQQTMIAAGSAVQSVINKNADIGLKPADVIADESRISNLIQRFGEATSYDDVAFLTNKNTAESITRSAINDCIKTNAKAQEKAGLKVLISRSDGSGCCEWCASVTGTFKSFDALPDGFWGIHRGCGCTIDYNVGKTHSRLSYGTDNKGNVVKNTENSIDNIRKSDSIIKSSKINYKTQKMSNEEYARAKQLWTKVIEIDISRKEKEYVYAEFDNNLSYEEKQSAIVSRPIGNHRYYAVNLGHNQYKIYKKTLIDRPKNVVDEVLTEMFGTDYQRYLDDSNK